MSAEFIGFFDVIINRLVRGFVDKKRRGEDFLSIQPPAGFMSNITDTQVLNAAGLMSVEETKETVHAKRATAHESGQGSFMLTMSSILEHDVFKKWFQSAGSDTIIIVCEPKPTNLALTSMLAELASHGTANTEWARSLTFFCGLHDRRSEGDDALWVMFKSFIAQLVAEKADVPGILGNFTAEDLGTLNTGSTKDICDLFVKVVKNVRAGTIFCIIDSIGNLQGAEGGHCGYVMAALDALVHDTALEKSRRHSQLVFKLLVTASGTGHKGNLDIWFPREPVLNIAKDSRYKDGHRVTSQ